jgi:hypothetical protein
MVLSADIPKATPARGLVKYYIAFEFVEIFRIYIFVLEQVMKFGEHPEVFACGFSWLVRIELCSFSDLFSIILLFVIRTSVARVLNVLMRLIKEPSKCLLLLSAVKALFERGGSVLLTLGIPQDTITTAPIIIYRTKRQRRRRRTHQCR